MSWIYDVSKCAPQEALRDLDKAFANFFKSIKQGKIVDVDNMEEYLYDLYLSCPDNDFSNVAVSFQRDVKRPSEVESDTCIGASDQ